jgi:hypothetical protein
MAIDHWAIIGQCGKVKARDGSVWYYAVDESRRYWDASNRNIYKVGEKLIGWVLFDEVSRSLLESELKDAILEEMYREKYKKEKVCTCGAAKTSNPNLHSHWCDSL